MSPLVLCGHIHINTIIQLKRTIRKRVLSVMQRHRQEPRSNEPTMCTCDDRSSRNKTTEENKIVLKAFQRKKKLYIYNNNNVYRRMSVAWSKQETSSNKERRTSFIREYGGHRDTDLTSDDSIISDKLECWIISVVFYNQTFWVRETWTPTMLTDHFLSLLAHFPLSQVLKSAVRSLLANICIKFKEEAAFIPKTNSSN